MTLTVMIMCYMFLSLFSLFSSFSSAWKDARPCRCSFFNSLSHILCDCCRYITGQFDVHAHFLRAKTELAFYQQQKNNGLNEETKYILLAKEEQWEHQLQRHWNINKNAARTQVIMWCWVQDARSTDTISEMPTAKIYFFVRTNAVHCNSVVMHFEHFINLFTCRRRRGAWWRGDGARSACRFLA